MSTTTLFLIPTADSPMDLPEIRIAVSSYLSRHALTICIRVCKEWHDSFVPCIWSRPLQVNLDSSTPLQPSATLFIQRAINIRQLKLHGIGFEGQGTVSYLPCQNLTNLRSLSIQRASRSGIGFSSSIYWDTLVNLAQQNPGLDTLRLLYIQGSRDIVSLFWDVVVGCCRSLKALHLYHYVEKSSDRCLFDILPFLRLDRLEIAHSIFHHLPRQDMEQTGSGGEIMSKSLPTVKVLRLLSLTETGQPSPTICPQARLLSLCPNLQELFVTSYGDETAIPRLISKEFKDNKWPHLISLSLHSLFFKDLELSVILDSFRRAQLETLSIRDGLFGPLSLAAFEKRHLGEGIKTLNLVRTTAARDPPMDEVSRIVQKIMEQSSALENLTVDVLQALDVAKGRNWACTGLRTFKKQTMVRQVCDNICDPFTKSERQDALFRQLGQLHQLTVLDLTGWHYHGMWYVWRLNLDLRHGLSQLSGLTQLRRLCFSKGQKLDMKDLEWMRKHWCDFREISRCLHPDQDEQKALQQVCTGWNWKLV
ncbi:hypothetical protein BGX24_009651 [Mortierella sp. AD032]|nr:hypothetical protein BGX24_009651 [Mortierella sp. AD032]